MLSSWWALQKWQLFDNLHNRSQTSAGKGLLSTMLSSPTKQSDTVTPWQWSSIWVAIANGSSRSIAGFAILRCEDFLFFLCTKLYQQLMLSPFQDVPYIQQRYLQVHISHLGGGYSCRLSGRWIFLLLIWKVDFLVVYLEGEFSCSLSGRWVFLPFIWKVDFLSVYHVVVLQYTGVFLDMIS